MKLWMTKVTTPHGPATEELVVRVALDLCDLGWLEVRPSDTGAGVWLIGFPPDLTEDWTFEKTGGGVIYPALDADKRLWLLDVAVPG